MGNVIVDGPVMAEHVVFLSRVVVFSSVRWCSYHDYTWNVHVL